MSFGNSTPNLDYGSNNIFQEKSFEELMLDAGYPLVQIRYNGKITRFGKAKKYWYYAVEGYAICGDWSSNLPKIELKSKVANNEFIENIKLKYKEEKLKDYKTSQKKALQIYSKLEEKPSTSHPYLKRKGIENFAKLDIDIRLTKSNNLVIPIKNIDNEITSLQFINEAGEKRFLKGGEVKSCFHLLGKIKEEVYICEGYATGLTIYGAIKKPVIICFNAGNLKPVCEALLKKYPYLKLTIAGDNDLYSTKNTGKEKCEELSKELGLKYFLPKFKNQESKPTDFNDLFILEGIEAVFKTLQKPYLRTFNLKELIETEIRQKEFILHPILKEGSLAMIYAKRGVGKTFVSLEVAFAVASGSNMFCGKWKASIQRKVLFIDGEMPLETIKQRLLSIIKRNANYNPENLIIINPEVQEEGMPDLATKEGQAIINEYITEDIKLIVLDNLSTLCRTGRENESESWIIIQDWILSLRRKGIAVLMVHHAGKNGEQRGNSKKEDILDTIINLKKPQDYNQSEGARFEVIYEKSRNFTGDEAKSFEAVLTENGFEIKDLELGMEAKVLELHSMNISQREIAKELELSLSKVNRIINKK